MTVILGYYIFFTIFFILACFEHPIIMDNFAFMKHIFTKSLFYAFCSSLCFSFTCYWSCDLVGSIFAVLVLLNCLRYCCVR